MEESGTAWSKAVDVKKKEDYTRVIELREKYEVKRAGRGGRRQGKDAGGLKGANIVQDVLI